MSDTSPTNRTPRVPRPVCGAIHMHEGKPFVCSLSPGHSGDEHETRTPDGHISHSWSTNPLANLRNTTKHPHFER